MKSKVKIKRNSKVKLPSKLSGPSKVKVGFPRGRTDGDILDRAIWNHYGTRGGGWGGPIPARPFLMNAVRQHRKKYLHAMRTSALAILTGDMSTRFFLSKLGIMAQGDVQQSITDLRDPPNSPVTIELKGSSNPLVDTGEMRGAVTFEVEP